MEVYMRTLFCGILTILLAGNALSATKKVILLHHNTDHQAPNIAKNVSYIETLPIDGMEVMADPASHEAMNKGSSVSYTNIYDENLKLIQGKFSKVVNNYVVIFVGKPADYFDNGSWKLVVNNWRLFTRAAKAAGLKGIFYDNEGYSGIWNYMYDYPTRVDSSSKYTMQQYRDQTRLRGKQCMQACIEEFPNIEVMVYHGPYFSEPKSPDGGNAQWAELMGSFFVGMYEATINTQAYIYDGGECSYSYRTADRFQSSYDWRKTVIASASNNSPNIPVELRASWPQKVKISFGLYKQDGTAPAMSPTVCRNVLEYALRTCDDFVWFYGNWNEVWLAPPGTALQSWLPAISGARGAANSGISFNCPNNMSVETGGKFSFTFTYDNFTGSTATLTYPKKPSWITATNGNATITGTAPTSARTDTVTAIVSAGSSSDTLKLTINVVQYTVIEAETGTLTSPMQIGNDAAASGGRHITAPAGAGNTIFPKTEATYTFNAPSSGNYYVWLKVYIPSINSSANYGTFIGFNGKFVKPGIANQNTGQYEWIFCPTPNSLTAGPNQLILGHGNEQVRIDKIIITNSPDPQLPAGMTSSLPQDKKNINQQKKNLSIRIMPNGGVQFLGAAGLEGTHLSVRDIFGRERWSNQGERSNGIIWTPGSGSSRISNGVYFVMLQQRAGSSSEVGKFTLAR